MPTSESPISTPISATVLRTAAFNLLSEPLKERHLRDVLGEEAYQGLREHFEAALLGSRASCEHATPREGETRWLAVTLIPDVEANGVVSGCTITTIDVTQQKRTERQLQALRHDVDSGALQRAEARDQPAGELERSQENLREREARLRAILGSAVDGIISIDEAGAVQSLNPAAERLFGYSEAEVIGKNVSLLMPSPYREEHDGYLEAYRKTSHARIIGIGREVEALRKNGEVFPIHLSVGQARLGTRRIFTASSTI